VLTLEVRGLPVPGLLDPPNGEPMALGEDIIIGGTIEEEDDEDGDDENDGMIDDDDDDDDDDGMIEEVEEGDIKEELRFPYGEPESEELRGELGREEGE